MNSIARHLRRSGRETGVTLVELMVAVVIGLIVILAATNVVLMGEAHKRTTTGNNDSSQSGAFTAYALDRALRSAGSGFAQAWDQGIFGCNLNVTRAPASVVLPRAGAFPAPFAGFLGGAGSTLRLAPVLIGQGQSAGGSDVLMVMSGNAAAGDALRPVASGSASQLLLDNTVGLKSGGIGLVTSPSSTDCLLEEIGPMSATQRLPGNQELPIGGATYASGNNLAALASTTTASFTPLGNSSGIDVQFQLFGVDANRTLVAYDLVHAAGNGTDIAALQQLADGVAELHAIYGVDSSSPRNNTVDDWVAPTGVWAPAALMADPARMRQIIAVRLAIVMRATNYEKEPVTTQRPALFVGTPGEVPAATYAAGTDDQHFRLRVIETTIPLRNMLLLPTP